MNTMQIIAWVIAGTAGIAAVLFGYLAYSRGKKTDDCAESKKDGAMLSDIGYIKSGVDDIKRKQEKQDERHLEVISRLATVEEKVIQIGEQANKTEARLIALETKRSRAKAAE